MGELVLTILMSKIVILPLVQKPMTPLSPFALWYAMCVL